MQAIQQLLGEEIARRAVTAFAPASVSNVACGFDIMGFALDGPGDRVTVRRSEMPGVRIRRITGTRYPLPMDVALNTAGPPVLAVLERSGRETGIEIDIEKGLPVGSGIGSSAASAVAAAVAANALLDAGLSHHELLECAIEGEKIASGSVHVDNLAPSLWGGFILVRGYDPPDIVRITAPRSLWCTVVHPDIEIRTIEARKVLPSTVPLADVIRQTGNAAGLVAGLIKEDLDLIGRSLNDAIAEPARQHLIPGFSDMKRAALAAGALGCSISGSGPSVFALARSRESAEDVGAAMGRVLKALGCEHSVMISGISQRGATIMNAGEFHAPV